MPGLRLFISKLKGLLPGRRDVDVDDEIRVHLDLLTNRYIQQGLTPTEASSAARRQFGNSTLLRERRREIGTFFALSTVLSDVRFAIRQLRRDLVLSLTAICSLALGIGANTAIFSVAKRVLFDTLPVQNPQELRLATWISGPERPVPPVWGDVSATKEGGLSSTVFSYPVLEEMRKQPAVFQYLIAFKDISVTASIEGHPELVNAEMLSGDAFTGLGVQPVLGRVLMPTDDQGPGTGPVVVVSEGYWAERFGRSPFVLGKTIALNGVAVTIVGVAPAHFAGLNLGTVSRLFFPLTMQPLIVPRAQAIGSRSNSLLSNPDSWWISVLVRLRPGVPEARTQAALDVVVRETAKATLPATKALDSLSFKLQPGDRGLDYLAGFAKPSYVLLALSVLVLSLACVNLANLLLARAASRRREISTRLALGAGRLRILRQVLTESLLLSLVGGMAGLLLGYAGRNAIPRIMTTPWRPSVVEVDFDWKVLLFTLAISLITGLFFGIIPAWQAMRADVNSALKDGSHSTDGRPRVWLARGLVVSQVALSAVLLIGAGLFLRTLSNLSQRPLGFDANNLLLFQLNLPRARYTDAQGNALYQQLEEKLALIPGVRAVTLSTIALIGDGHSGSTFHRSGTPLPPQGADRVQANGVGSDFFSTMGIPLIAGRSFNASDANGPAVAIINHALAKRYFANQDPLGQLFDSEDVDGPVRIVGVVENTRYANLRDETPPTFYLSNQQRVISGRMVFELRTAPAPFSVLSQVRTTVESLDRDLPLIDIRTQTQQIEASLSTERVFAQLTTAFGLLAVMLSSIGIYGIMAYTVARRTGEIGIRMALGAEGHQVLAMVLRDSLWMALTGVVLGICVALWLARFVGTMLYGLGASDPFTLMAAASLLILVALLAGVYPAHRASHINPTVALRHD